MAKKNKNKKRPKKDKEARKTRRFSLPGETKRLIWASVSFLVAVLITLSFFDLAGAGGKFFINGFSFLFGKAIFLLPLLLVLGGLAFFSRKYKNKWPIILALSLLALGISGTFELFNHDGRQGGWAGYLISWPFLKTFGAIATQVILGGLIAIGAGILWQFLYRPKPSAAQALEVKKEKEPTFIKRIFGPKFKVTPLESLPPLEMKIENKMDAKEKSSPFDLKTKPLEASWAKDYRLPPLDLLESDKGVPTAGDIRINSAIIKRTLQNFDIQVEMSGVNIGPTVTQYTLKPAEGVKLSKITSLSNDLSLALASHPIRIEAPIPGKPLIGIEVPNKARTLVRLRNLIEHQNFQNSISSLTLALGRDVSGVPVFADLARMPHLLVAGSTGTGKTCAADTLVFTEKGLLTFEELYPLPLNSEADFEIKVVSRDGIETTKKIYNNGICQFYKLFTNRGYQIEATAEHPLWVIDRAGVCGWKPATAIKEGDYVAISREPALFGNKVDISNFKPSEIKAYHKKVSFPLKMTPKLAQFLGLLTADGCLSVERKAIHRITYTQANADLLSLFKKSLKELFRITQFIEKTSGSNPNNKAKEIVVNSKHVKEFLVYLGMDSLKSPQKVMPRAIREAPKEAVRAYLQALFDNDGYVGKESIELTLSSEKLISQVQIMLLNFEIISSLKLKVVKNYAQNKYFRLSIYGEEARKFIKEIGFIRKGKYEKAKNLLKLSSNPNVDLIPHLSSLLKTLAHKYLNYFAHLTNKGWQYQSGILIPKYAFSSLKSYNSGERTPSYQAVQRILDFYQPISKEVEYQKLREASERNFYWDKVAKIDRTSGIGYDFFVPGSDSFTGNGFINHNTICLNSIILSLLYQNSPEILRFILIDPKRVEFPVYNELPHLLTPVIFDAQRTINTLKWLIGEMERRFDVLSQDHSRDIVGYNESMLKQGLPPMPYIVLVIDELADLMAARGREVEAGIVRLAQMARAVGIHLIVATQRPSVEVITGLIKANITSRITFQVASQVDSRTVLDMAGAERLLGLGDMLFISAEIAKPKRIQAAYISDKEVKKVAKYIKSENQKLPEDENKEAEITAEKNNLSESLEETLEKTGEVDFFSGEDDPLYEEAKKVVIEAKKASASLLQRRLRVGYARAARLIDMLEGKGVVGPGEGAKPREILINTGEEAKEEDEGWKKI